MRLQTLQWSGVLPVAVVGTKFFEQRAGLAERRTGHCVPGFRSIVSRLSIVMAAIGASAVSLRELTRFNVTEPVDNLHIQPASPSLTMV